MRRVEIAGSDLAEIGRHALSTHPLECCGILVGARDREVCRVTGVLRASNAFEGPAGDGYRIPPQQLLAALRDARSAGREVVGYYHSHPNGSPRPSALDLERAWPEVTYLIVPVRAGKVGKPKGWCLASGREDFEEEEIRISSEEHSPRATCL